MYHQFWYWRQKFSCADDTSTGPKVIPVALAAPSQQVSDLEVILPNGVVIRGVDEGNVSTVASLVASL